MLYEVITNLDSICFTNNKIPCDVCEKMLMSDGKALQLPQLTNTGKRRDKNLSVEGFHSLVI